MATFNRTFGKYRLLKKIAVGGMGEIFLAKITGPVGFEKHLVIKRVLEHHVENEQLLDMFFSEARVAAQLQHSNVVQIYEMGQIDGAFFIAMEYIHGQSLHGLMERVRKSNMRLAPHLVVDIAAQLCAGLSYAHNAKDMSGESLGIVHRDINPHNILSTYGGEVKVIDFGIAKSGMSMHETEAGTIKGKFVYMSPEQSAAKALDKRSDIFAVGICLYELLTFANPFAKSNVVLSLDAIQRKNPPPVSETNPAFAPFDALISKALAKKADDRYSDCEELRDELLELVRNGSVPKTDLSLRDFMADIFSETIREDAENIKAWGAMVEAQPDQTQPDIKLSSTVQALPAHHSSFREMQGNQEYRRQSRADSLNMNDNRRGSRAAMEHYAPRHSRSMFYALLSLIVMGTLGASGGILHSRGIAMDGLFAKKQNVRAQGQLAADTSSGAASPAPAPAPAPVSDSNATSLPGSTTKAVASGSGPVVRRPKKTQSKRDNYGKLQVYAFPSYRLSYSGMSQRQSVVLKGASGKLTLVGSGVRKFEKIEVYYRVKKGDVSFTEITAEPWALVQDKNGIGLGKTPINDVFKGNQTFVLLNPQGYQARIKLIYMQPSR
jgi:eukaryotic-like serine/threonine-protein kinase